MQATIWKKKCAVIVFVFITLLIFNHTFKVWMNRSEEMCEPIVIAFPLWGEWYSPNTPETKIPSHGTDRLGTRFAYDYIQVDWEKKGWPAYHTSLLNYLLFGVSLNEYYCWGQEIYALCAGTVIDAKDGYEEQSRTNLLADMSNAYKNAHYFDPEKDDVQSVAGNYVIIKKDDNVYAALCHLQTGSIQVSASQNIKKGELVGKIGHSGNSFAPHLHFQLMDSSHISTANRLPCVFEQYKIFQDGEWKTVKNGIPTNKDRIRFEKGE